MDLKGCFQRIQELKFQRSCLTGEIEQLTERVVEGVLAGEMVEAEDSKGRTVYAAMSNPKVTNTFDYAGFILAHPELEKQTREFVRHTASKPFLVNKVKGEREDEL